MLAGRAIQGVTYQAIDVLPLPLLAPHFPEGWGTLVGLLSAALRVGSVANFGLSPALYRAGGLPAALWASAAFGFSALVLSVAMLVAERRRVPIAPAGVAGQPNNAETSAMDVALGEAGSEGGEKFRCGGERCLFVLFLGLGALQYSAIAPFWFFGGGFIRDKWGCTLEVADLYMFFVEGSMVVLAPAVGMALDRYARTLRVRFRTLAASLVVVVAGFVLLAAMPAAAAPPAVPLAVMSVAYAWSNTCFWSFTSNVLPKSCFALAAGVLGGALNLGPTVLPLLMARAGTGAVAVSYLAAAAAGAAALAAAHSLVFHPSARV
uniref:Lysosomal dipeptide transporter MFSD1 n=1 Tax=Zooxanthella nutricula TaxID=1333877 RepID=A0A7S2N5B4_9DINO